jgi:hypothetical protein
MKKLLPLISLLALCATPAFADMDGKDTMSSGMDHHKMMEDAMFKKMDTNGDGYISKSEHDAVMDKMFHDADTNGDGKISKEEVMAYKMKEKQEMKSTMSDRATTSEDAKSTTNGSAATNSK